MRSIGIMQGRLTEPSGRGIQFFPFDEWKIEFKKAQEIGLDEIEWIFDYPNYQNNPLWTNEGQAEICSIIQCTGIKVRSVCWDYFMRRPFYKQEKNMQDALLNENKKILQHILEAIHKIGANLIEIPMVDDSSVKTDAEEEQILTFIRWICDRAALYEIKVGLETDFPPGKFRTFLDNVYRKNVVANYDSGNSSGLGFDHRDELLSLGEYVCNVHIKDRLKGDGTVPLGTGSANFDEVFSTLKQIGYRGSFILQAARGDDGAESITVTEQVNFLKKFLNKYKLS